MSNLAPSNAPIEPPLLVEQAAERLTQAIGQFESCVVAFSGGVDSAVVAMAAQAALGERAIAVTGVSASLADGELETAKRVAASIGIEHAILRTEELADEQYLANRPDRCFHCKSELYGLLSMYAAEREISAVLSGANIDDLGDFRPGLQAAAQEQVVHPLADCKLTKQHVRELAQHWGLEVWDKPATPCLSSRVVYGLGITPERLARIDAAEQLLRELSLGTVRVRHHQDDLARLEVPVQSLPRLCEPTVRERLVTELRRLGFAYVTVDLEGFRSGSFQQLVSVEELTAGRLNDQ